MPRVEVSSDDITRREARAVEWRRFRRDYLFTQAALADVLKITRRSVVNVENCSVTNPHPDLLREFRNLKLKHERERERAA